MQQSFTCAVVFLGLEDVVPVLIQVSFSLKAPLILRM